MNLYELTVAQKKLLELIEQLESEDAKLDTLEAEGFGDDINKKLEAYAVVAREFESRADARKAESERLAKLAASDKAKVEKLRGAIFNAMTALNIKKVDTDLFCISLRKTPESVDVFGDVPDVYMTQPKPIVSKSLIKDAIKNGVDVSAFAKLTSVFSLSIK